MYTDSDTMCLQSLRHWPGLAERDLGSSEITDHFLSTLPQMDDLRFRSSQHPAKHWRRLSAHGYVSFTPSDFWQPPKLIVAVEAENWGPMMDESWTTTGWSRGFQIVQVSYMSTHYA